MPKAKLLRGPYLYNLDAFDEVDERIPRRHGFWHTSGIQHRTRKVARRQMMRKENGEHVPAIARNSDSPIRNPDRPPMSPRYDDKGRRLEDHVDRDPPFQMQPIRRKPFDPRNYRRQF